MLLLTVLNESQWSYYYSHYKVVVLFKIYVWCMVVKTTTSKYHEFSGPVSMNFLAEEEILS
jgi:hypothetical protein